MDCVPITVAEAVFRAVRRLEDKGRLSATSRVWREAAKNKACWDGFILGNRLFNRMPRLVFPCPGAPASDAVADEDTIKPLLDKILCRDVYGDVVFSVGGTVAGEMGKFYPRTGWVHVELPLYDKSLASLNVDLTLAERVVSMVKRVEDKGCLACVSRVWRDATRNRAVWQGFELERQYLDAMMDGDDRFKPLAERICKTGPQGELCFAVSGCILPAIVP